MIHLTNRGTTKKRKEMNIELLKIYIQPYKKIEIMFSAIQNLTVGGNKDSYVGFSTDERNYVFKVSSKTIKLTGSKKQVVYSAYFYGYKTPTEEEMLSANWHQIVDEEIIKQAAKESRYT